jgi:hypothetical protein
MVSIVHGTLRGDYKGFKVTCLIHLRKSLLKQNPNAVAEVTEKHI